MFTAHCTPPSQAIKFKTQKDSERVSVTPEKTTQGFHIFLRILKYRLDLNEYEVN